MKKNAIADTNIFLHWDIQSVDWCSELDASEVDIIVCRTVLRELDRKKDGANDKLADRARKSLQLIESLDASGEPLRQNVHIIALTKEPKIDWQKEELDPDVKDDRIIAAMLERRNNDDILITDDTTPRITARKKHLAVQELQALKKPEPKSDLEKELENAKKEIADLKYRIPVVGLRLNPPIAKDSIATFLVSKSQPMTGNAIKGLVVERQRILRSKLENISNSRVAESAIGFDVEGYMSDITEHLVKYENYLKEKNEVEQRLAGVISIGFTLYSEGNVPAEDVKCDIRFPDGFTLVEDYHIPKIPIEPDMPAPMQRVYRLLYPALYGNSLRSLGSLGESVYAMRNTGQSERQSSVLLKSNEVRIWIKRLQHEFVFNAETVHVRLPSLDDLKTFEIKYGIFAANLPKSVKGTIPVKLQSKQQ